MSLSEEVKDRIILRRMSRILSIRVQRLEGVTIYKGGFVELSKVMEKIPLFTRFELSEADTLAKLSGDSEGRFTVQGKYVKVNEGHAFDPAAEDLPDVPAE